MNGAVSDFWYWLDYNVLLYSEGIIILQKSLFSHTFLWDSSFFCCKRMKAIPKTKITVIFEVIPLKNVATFFDAR